MAYSNTSDLETYEMAIKQTMPANATVEDLRSVLENPYYRIEWEISVANKDGHNHGIGDDVTKPSTRKIPDWITYEMAIKLTMPAHATVEDLRTVLENPFIRREWEISVANKDGHNYGLGSDAIAKPSIGEAAAKLRWCIYMEMLNAAALQSETDEIGANPSYQRFVAERVLLTDNLRNMLEARDNQK